MIIKQWNVYLDTKSAFALGLREVVENLEIFGRAQNLSDACRLPEKSRTSSTENLTTSSVYVVALFFKNVLTYLHVNFSVYWFGYASG
jgi:hypothetical protein